jgi:hypothetical protein
MVHFEITTRLADEQRRDWLAKAEQRRLVAACGPQITLARRVARPIGRALMVLGATLLRYGRADTPETARPYRASASSIRLN